MARFSQQTVDQVRSAVDVAQVMSPFTDLRRAGQRLVGLCPFHEERTPSFSVDPGEKLYYCFGCQAHGDVFSFVMEKEGLAFPEAVETLADRFGVEVEREREDPRAEAARKRRERISELLERTATFYVGVLWESPKADKARRYLEDRGLGEGVLREFAIGFAPSAWDQVLTRGQRAGFSVDELRAAGLVQEGRGGGAYDRFRARITFPVRDQRGRVLGFGARSLSADTKPKYLNSPEGELYRKSRTLYGVDRARGAIAKAGRAVVVEGYTDVLSLHQAGNEESVAVMGTAITDGQLGILSGLTEEIVLAMDADRAGEDAMLRAQRVGAERSLRIRVAAMPEGKDPADMLAAEGGEEAFRALVESATELPAFRVDTALRRADVGSAGGRDRALAELAPVLGALEESASRDELVRRVADRLDLEPELVSRRVQLAEAGGGAAPSGNGAGGSAPATVSARERRERALLAMCIAEPGRGGELLSRLAAEHMSSPVATRALAWLRDHLDDPVAGLPRDDDELVSLITALVMLAEREPASAEAMELNFLQMEQRLLEDRIAEARKSGDERREVELGRDRAELVKRIRQQEGTTAAN
jgi:DNA primase